MFIRAFLFALKHSRVNEKSRKSLWKEIISEFAQEEFIKLNAKIVLKSNVKPVKRKDKPNLKKGYIRQYYLRIRLIICCILVHKLQSSDSYILNADVYMHV